MYNIYNQNDNYKIFSINSTQRNRVMTQFSLKCIYSLILLHEYPFMRYWNNGNCINVISKIQNYIDGAIRRSTLYVYNGQININDRSCVLLLDRTMDILSPLLHPTTYHVLLFLLQSLLEDLFSIENHRLYLLYKTDLCYINSNYYKTFTYIKFPINDIIWEKLKDIDIDCYNN